MTGVVASLEKKKRSGVCWFGSGTARWQCGGGSAAKTAASDLKMSVKTTNQQQKARGRLVLGLWFDAMLTYGVPMYFKN